MGGIYHPYPPVITPLVKGIRQQSVNMLTVILVYVRKHYVIIRLAKQSLNY